MAEKKDVSFADMDEDKLLRSNKKLLDALLFDYSTEKNIRWATNNYSGSGIGFEEEKEIKAQLVTGWYNGLIKPRAEKDHETRLERTRNKAEVFTPSWIVKKQVGAILEEMKDLSFEEFIDKRWLEITCGEGPYMANRYDMLTGEIIALEKRAGFIDEKFRRLNEKVKSKKSWIDWAIRIYKASYGYEYQGDSLLLARENLLLTFIDNYFYMFGDFPKDKLLLNITELIARNVIQMDGLTYLVPYSKEKNKSHQLSMLEELAVEDSKPVPARIHLWHLNKTVNFIDIVKESEGQMKFDVVIGNPPFNETIESRGEQPPIYNYFYDSAIELSKLIILITPARFLFDAGKTPSKWNHKMLKSEHFKVLMYEPEAVKIFPTTDIKGGVAITIWDNTKATIPIETYYPDKNVRSIVTKVRQKSEAYFPKIMYSNTSYKYTKLFYEENPDFIGRVSGGSKRYLSSSCFSKFPEAFHDNELNGEYIEIMGRLDKSRVSLYIKESYINPPDNFYFYKLVLPSSSGRGEFGETISGPFVGEPKVGYTETFVTFGKFEEEDYAKNILKYIKGKFSRFLLSSKKVTQGNKSAKVWGNVPLQDFTSSSDIDWSKSIPEIDQQLYKKYGLTQEEIDFIETNVKEME